jgi:methionyl-tRNA formyltransferase
MAEKPDAGDIVGQQAVPILPDDTAKDVFDKVTVAAEIALDSVLPELIAGTASHVPQDLAQGSYFGGRSAEDGRIDWTRSALQIHNLVRAVAPPYPGALTTVAGVPARVLRTRVLAETSPTSARPEVSIDDDRLVAHCGGGGTLALDALEIAGSPVDASLVVARFGRVPVQLGP